MRFVLIEHKCPYTNDHFDLMLERENHLETYRVEELSDLTRTARMIVKIKDHDKKFLTYEGPVNKGKGYARRADQGEYITLEGEKLKFTGRILSGIFRISSAEGENYLLEPVSKA
ncbi:DNA ligase D, 3'-phosphoesterase domain [Sedimentisphaera cyanobacteriorum]|uniref:DNA ligase D, 3'-phosphoesterase domain n=1 Tax=Sedimentisphaera cyanobacteriorum TaxID=1940790 RepID=A0A1Q2HQ58_9BACT|nr:DNA polymerase ligase N-terminal domain-containing protein [Sedimentisphaera cyanobacteriorum]AQQ09558.1 DNA ligase D, 3'-phosphoesterase domain [Sedimentisphaera cyanobacteriorum]